MTRKYLDHVWSHAAEKVQVEGYGEATLIEVLAADGYRDLRKFHRGRQQRDKRKAK
jgi:hypothetical protein